jgi:hypothetical protein
MKKDPPGDPDRDDPEAAAEAYRAARKAGTWRPEYGEYLMMLQSTEEGMIEVGKLMTKVDREEGW